MPNDPSSYTAAGRAAASSYSSAPTQKGSRAGESFASSADVKAQQRADKFRVMKRKSFAWSPPKKSGQDPEWDAFNAAEDAKDAAGAAASKAQPLAQTGM